MPASISPEVFRYEDYRKFLADHYAYAKEHDYGFSFRVFSKRAGISSSNFLRLVIDGKRNLSASMAPQFAAACGLKQAAADFFCELVAYNQAKTARERTRHYEQLRRFRPFREVHQLDAEQAEYHSQWYLPAIRELSLRPDFSDDPKWIATQLEPAISTRQAKQALATLVNLGLLECDAAGKLRQASALVSTGPGPLSHHVVNFHHAMLQRAGVALDRTPRDEREISSVTVCVSHDKLLELKQRVREFRRSLLEIAELDDDPERVVQINFQLFPLSKRRPNSDVVVSSPVATAPRARAARPAKKPARGSAQ
jgi:uncharacterized protein (TIGR02147 family)